MEVVSAQSDDQESKVSLRLLDYKVVKPGTCEDKVLIYKEGDKTALLTDCAKEGCERVVALVFKEVISNIEFDSTGTMIVNGRLDGNTAKTLNELLSQSDDQSNETNDFRPENLSRRNFGKKDLPMTALASLASGGLLLGLSYADQHSRTQRFMQVIASVSLSILTYSAIKVCSKAPALYKDSVDYLMNSVDQSINDSSVGQLLNLIVKKQD